MTSFLPKGYESLKTEKSYWKMSQMKDGENRLRIVMQPVAGWLDWKDNKPMRSRPENKPLRPINPEKPIRPFWACYVWDYSREGLYILEITQSSILKSLTSFATDSDWGDFTGYDLKIHKEGTGKETRYSLTPLPHKPLSDKIQQALKLHPVRLEALYDGGDPWTDLVEDEYQESSNETEPSVTPNDPLGALRSLLQMDGMDTAHLESYVKGIADMQKKPIEDIIHLALSPQRLPKFKQTFAREISKRSEQLESASA